MINKKGCSLFLVICFLVFFPLTAGAHGEPAGAKVVLANLTRVDFADFNTGDYPHLQRLLTQGHVGLVTVRVKGRLTTEKVYRALSAAPAGGGGEEGGAWSALGTLGALLRQGGKQTAFLGNADLPWQPNRAARILFSDTHGQVDYEFAAGSVLRADPDFPFGFRTDYQQMGDLVLALLPKTDLILVETGDLERLEAYRRLMAEEQWLKQRAQTLARIDGFLGRISAALPGQASLLVLVAAPASAFDGNDFPLLPLLIDQKKGASGLLTSPATRQPGLITGSDLAALLADLTSENVAGTSARWTTAGDWHRLQEERVYWGVNLRQRMIILRLYLCTLIFVLITAWWLPFTPWSRLTTYAGEVLPAFAFLPLAMLLLAPLRIVHWPLLAALLVVGTGGVWALARWLFPSRILAYRGLLVGTALVILVDLCFGSRLMLASLLGPSPVLGHRFYGLGNEYLGIFLGTFLLGTADFLITSPWRKWCGLLLGVGTLLVLSPSGGANFGGGVALSFAAGLICRRIQPPVRARRNILLFFLCLLVGLGWQMLGVGAGGTTHLHNALRLLRLGAWEQFFAIAARKVQMNLGLIQYSPWGPTLLFVYIILLSGLQVAERAALIKPEKEWYWLGTTIAVKTGLVAFLANDSGIVVLAPLVFYPLILLTERWLTGERKGLFALLLQAGRRCVGIGKN